MFNIGDVVIANHKADNYYSITTEGVRMVVSDVQVQNGSFEGVVIRPGTENMIPEIQHTVFKGCISTDKAQLKIRGNHYDMFVVRMNCFDRDTSFTHSPPLLKKPDLPDFDD